jgi:transmembrane sensor
MADIRPLKDQATLRREASEWIARLERENVTQADREAFADWLSTSPRHARAYESLRATWNELSATRSLVQAISFSSP